MWLFLPFFLALGAVWHHLSRGRTGRGLALLVVAFGLLDAFLVRGWVLGRWDGWTRVLEAVLWAVGVGEILVLVWRKLHLAGRRGKDAWRDLFLQGGRHYAQGDASGAARFFKKASRLDPWAPSPHVWAGFSLLLQGKRGGARRAFKRALARDRSGEWGRSIQRGMIRSRARGGEGSVPGRPGRAGRSGKGVGKRKVPA